MCKFVKMSFFYSTVFLLGILVINIQSGKCEKELLTLNTKQLESAINQARGKVVLVNFWATWCVPCRKELPNLNKLRNEYSEKNLLILGPSLDMYPSSVKRFKKRYDINFPIFLVTEDVQRYYKVSALPKSLLFNRQGKLEMEHLGYLPLQELRDRIDFVLN